MNDDLAAWANEGGEQADQAPNRIDGPCHQCESPATSACLRCDAPVCARHHHVMYGLCTRCTQAAATEPPRDLRDTLDIPWVDE